VGQPWSEVGLKGRCVPARRHRAEVADGRGHGRNTAIRRAALRADGEQNTADCVTMAMAFRSPGSPWRSGAKVGHVAAGGPHGDGQRTPDTATVQTCRPARAARGRAARSRALPTIQPSSGKAAGAWRGIAGHGKKRPAERPCGSAGSSASAAIMPRGPAVAAGESLGRPLAGRADGGPEWLAPWSVLNREKPGERQG